MKLRARLAALLFLVLPVAACEPPGALLFASPQADPVALSLDGSVLYVANTTSNTVSAIDTASQTELLEIPVGLEPVSLALRPDGNELWVANHVSDSVSVIDTNAGSPTFHTVTETVQSLDDAGVTAFDEPVGIAFASNAKAYVALSSRDRIAVVDASSYQVTGELVITAQDPRAMRVRNGRLYVLAFESGNGSELSACANGGNPPQCTLGINQLGNFATQPNLPGVPKNVVLDPDVPDRDLFVFDTGTDQLVAGSPVDGVGTLLYGLAVSSNGTVYVANTDARNHHLDGNGLAAPPPNGLGQGLADLQNRIFRNRITRVDCSGNCGAPQLWDLEPVPGQGVPLGTQLATPYGIALSDDDALLVVTAAASSRIASVDPATGAVLDRLNVGAIPRGVTLRSLGGGAHRAYVLNTLDNSVSIVDVAANGALSLAGTVVDVGTDPTPEAVRLGRIAFNDAHASSTGTFSCASCHPDANVDQLLWIIGATCEGCSQEDPRSTMPVRGLRGTLPLHWDGVLGDPIGGPNGETGPGGDEEPNCNGNDPASCFRQLVDASLSGVMCSQPCTQPGPSGFPGQLDTDARNNMAAFLENVAPMPPRSRPLDDVVTASAMDGFADFFLNQGGNGGGAANTCADANSGCHALPLGASTNSPVVGAFDAPSMRGMTDRFLQFSMGITAPEEILDIAGAFAPGVGVIPWDPAVGLTELNTFSVAFAVFNPVYNVFPQDMWQMFEEASTGFSGALGRQVTVNARTMDPDNGSLAADTEALLADLEAADGRFAINLRGAGLHFGQPLTVGYHAGVYRDEADWENNTFTRQDLLDDALNGDLVMTFTGAMPMQAGRPEPEFHQPLLSPQGNGGGPTGNPDIPVLPGDNPIRLTGVNIREDSEVLVDGRLVNAVLSCVNGTFDFACTSELIDIELLDPVTPDGLHLLQVVTLFGLHSNEIPICVGPPGGCL